jgi:hypothetical protein
MGLSFLKGALAAAHMMLGSPDSASIVCKRADNSCWQSLTIELLVMGIIKHAVLAVAIAFGTVYFAKMILLALGLF